MPESARHRPRRRASVNAAAKAAGRAWRLHPRTGKVHLFLGGLPQRALCGTRSFSAVYHRHEATGYCSRCMHADPLSHPRPG